MDVEERLKFINAALQQMRRDRRTGFIRWAAARAGVPLYQEATFTALADRVLSYDEDLANCVLEGLEDGIYAVQEMR